MILNPVFMLHFDAIEQFIYFFIHGYYFSFIPVEFYVQ